MSAAAGCQPPDQHAPSFSRVALDPVDLEGDQRTRHQFGHPTWANTNQHVPSVKYEIERNHERSLVVINGQATDMILLRRQCQQPKTFRPVQDLRSALIYPHTLTMAIRRSAAKSRWSQHPVKASRSGGLHQISARSDTTSQPRTEEAPPPWRPASPHDNAEMSGTSLTPPRRARPPPQPRGPVRYPVPGPHTGRCQGPASRPDLVQK